MTSTEDMLQVIKDAVQQSELVEGKDDKNQPLFKVQIPYSVFRKMAEIVKETSHE